MRSTSKSGSSRSFDANQMPSPTRATPSIDWGLTSGSATVLKCTMILLTTIVTVSCDSNSVHRRVPSLSERLGVVSTKANEGCLEIRNPSLEANTEVRIVNLSGQLTSGIARLGVRTSSCGSDSGADRLNAYVVRFEKGVLPGQMPMIGVVNYVGKIKSDGDLVSVDLDGDGQLEYFHSCVSTEGIHFTAWTGRPLVGKLRWHQYHYLGYDVTPTCTKAELGSAK
jgi:hypothetical protein